MKYITTVILLGIFLNATAQFVGKCFQSKTYERLCFIDSSNVNLRFHHYERLKTPVKAQGSYFIRDNTLTISFYNYPEKSKSEYVLLDCKSNDKTIINIECFACQFVEWTVKDKGLLISGHADEKGKIVLNNIDSLNLDSATINIGYGKMESVEIPIIFYAESTYKVLLRREFIYIENGELNFKIKKKNNNIILKSLSGSLNNRNYINLKNMLFYEVEKDEDNYEKAYVAFN